MQMCRWLTARLAFVGVVLALFSGTPAEAQSSFRSRSFEVTTNLTGDIVKRLVNHMDIVYAEMERRFASFPDRTGTKPELYVYSDAESYVRGLFDRFRVNVGGSGGVFVVRGSEVAIAAWVGSRGLESVEETLQHEAFHLIHEVRLGGEMPLWLNEGLAEYFGRGMVVKGKFRLGIVDRGDVARLREYREAGEFVPVREMVLVNSEQWWRALQEGNAGALYLQSWAMAHFLLEADGGRYRGELVRYMRHCADGMDHARAWERVFGSGERALVRFERAWEEWLEEVEPDPISVARERLTVWALAIQELHERGEVVDDLDGLRERMDELGWSCLIELNGEERVVTAADAEWFEAPDDSARVQLAGRAGEAEPMRLLIRGMRGVRPRIEWEAITEENRNPGEEAGRFRSVIKF